MILGIDESGRGPVIGDMVIAGVLLPTKESELDLVQRGVKDSKKLTRKKRESLYPHIQRASAKIVTKIISASQVDGWRNRGKSLNDLEAKFFSEIIEEAPARRVFVDCSDVLTKTFRARIERDLGRAVPDMVCRHFADDTFPVVSAASVVAKVVRDRRIGHLNETYGEIGSGYCHDARTLRFLEKCLESDGFFPPIVRKTWYTASRIREARSQTRLAE
jgi:ribonuclease HII